MQARIAGATLALLFSAGCVVDVGMPVVPSVGSLYERIKAPVQTDMKGTSLGRKQGTVRMRHLRFPFYSIPLISWGDTPKDVAIHQAAKNGGITTIRHIDYERFSILSTYVELTIIVYGD